VGGGLWWRDGGDIKVGMGGGICELKIGGGGGRET